MKESLNLEWKESWRDEHLKVICAGGNAGLLDFGPDVGGNVLGTKDIGKNSVDIPNEFDEDKQEDRNPGQLPTGWTIDNLLRRHSSQPFNPDISNVFFRAGMVESWGQGIQRIQAACIKANAPIPVFEADGSGLWVILPFMAIDAVQDDAKNTVQDDVKSTVQDDENAQSDEAAYLLFLNAAVKPSSRQEIQDAIGYKNVGYFRERFLGFSLQNKHIAMTIPDRPNSKLQRYQLTRKGKAYLNQFNTERSSE